MRKKIARSVAMGLVGLLIQQGSGAAFGPPPEGPPTATPIKHLVVIFPENISFDHYFGTYPVAANPAGEPPFQAQSWTPNVNGLSGALLTNNPNFLNSLNNSTSNTGGGSGAALNPFRLDRSQAATSDQNHDYGPEQAAADLGLMDLFPSMSAWPVHRRRQLRPMASRWAITTATPSPRCGTTRNTLP